MAKKIRITLAVFLMAVAASIATTVGAAPAQCGGHGDRSNMLVTSAWLADHLHDANVVVLAIGDKKDYDQGHIPGSIFANYSDFYMKGPTGLHTELPPMEQLANVVGKLGVTNESHIILYQAKDWFSPTARVYLTLDAMGLATHTSVLDGGFLLWSKEGRAVSTDVPTVKPGTVTTCAQNDVIADLAFVSGNMKHAGVAIVDARDTEFYTGEKQPGPDGRLGHIPGAGSLVFTTLADENGKWKSPEELTALLRAAGVKPGDRVVSYCHVGQQASAVYFAARYLGYDARLYDGSWDEWSQNKELPAETTAGVKVVKQ